MNDKTPNSKDPLETDIDDIDEEINSAPPGKPPDTPGGGAEAAEEKDLSAWEPAAEDSPPEVPAPEKTAPEEPSSPRREKKDTDLSRTSSDKAKSKDKVKTKTKDDGKNKVKKWLLRIIILLLLIAILLLVLKQCGVFDDKTPAPVIAGDLFPDGNAEDGPLSNMTKEEIMEQMQKEADANYFSFKINTEIVFEDGNSEGNVGIENPNNNVYPMSVQIFLGKDGAGELIYDSGGLMPNQHIDNDKLTKVLSTGTYEALAYLYAYDPETKVNIFKSTAELKIIIKN